MANQDNARKLLERLSHDDAFRAEMESNPVAAFAEYGFDIDPSVAPDKVQLPSKEDILGNTELLSKQLATSWGFVIFTR